MALSKARLTLLVVFSSLVSYFTLSEEWDGKRVLFLALGGFLITSCANTLNQILEQHSDKLMERTRQRPLPSETITEIAAWIIGGISGISGLVFLYNIGWLHALLGAISVILYAFVYTPLKKRTPWAVFVGAFPGSLPVLIGALAAPQTDASHRMYALLLFFIQFLWQFPHFWTLAWFNFEDYARASFFLLPSGKEKNPGVALHVLIYVCALAFFSMLPFFFHFTGPVSAACIMICNVCMVWQGYLFYRFPDDTMARRLFVISLVYLPVVQLSLMTGV